MRTRAGGLVTHAEWQRDLFAWVELELCVLVLGWTELGLGVAGDGVALGRLAEQLAAHLAVRVFVMVRERGDLARRHAVEHDLYVVAWDASDPPGEGPLRRIWKAIGRPKQRDLQLASRIAQAFDLHDHAPAPRRARSRRRQ